MLTPAWEVVPDQDEPQWVHVNATATGGGVAELLHGLVRLQRAEGCNAGWAVIAGNDEFYAVTKYLHHLLHGQADPAPLREEGSLTAYRSALASQGSWLSERVGPGDVVVLHDPQTLGLAPHLSGTGARVLWHCHIGADVPESRGPGAVWDAFADDLAAVDGVITTLSQFAPSLVPAEKRHVACPGIDPAAPKNRLLGDSLIAELLAGIGLTSPNTSSPHAEVLQREPLPPEARVVVQVSRWDPLKDMPGVVRCVPDLPPDVHLVLVGTDPRQIPDDPEGFAVLAEVRETWENLPEPDRRRVHLVNTSLRSPEDSALIVNAVQRRADVVLQKSLAEGFGLSVTEALIKERPVVAAAVGGLRSQVMHGRTGLLVDPQDRADVVRALNTLLADPELARALGRRGARWASERYTIHRLVADYGAIAALPRVPGAKQAEPTTRGAA